MLSAKNRGTLDFAACLENMQVGRLNLSVPHADTLFSPAQHPPHSLQFMDRPSTCLEWAAVNTPDNIINTTSILSAVCFFKEKLFVERTWQSLAPASWHNCRYCVHI